jgi:hypothetical protein
MKLGHTIVDVSDVRASLSSFEQTLGVKTGLIAP